MQIVFKVDNNKIIETTSLQSFKCLYIWLWTCSMSCSYVSIFEFQQIFVCWKGLEFLEIPYNEITITYKHGGFLGQKVWVIVSYRIPSDLQRFGHAILRIIGGNIYIIRTKLEGKKTSYIFFVFFFKFFFFLFQFLFPFLFFFLLFSFPLFLILLHLFVPTFFLLFITRMAYLSFAGALGLVSRAVVNRAPILTFRWVW